MESVSSVVLVFENFGQDSFRIDWLTIVIDCLSIALDAHSSSMHCVELSFVIGLWTRRSLTTSSCLWSSISLSYWWPGNLDFSSRSWYQILCLIAARLKHQTLWLLSIALHSILNTRRINRLPCIFRSRLDLSILHHSIDDLLIYHVVSAIDIISFTMAVFLVD